MIFLVDLGLIWLNFAYFDRFSRSFGCFSRSFEAFWLFGGDVYGVELDSAQVTAIRELRNGKILCGEPGSGKSRAALAYFFKENGGYLNALDDRNGVANCGNGVLITRPDWVIGDDDGLMKWNPMDLYIITTAKKRDDMEWEAEMLPFLMQKGDFRRCEACGEGDFKHDESTGGGFSHGDELEKGDFSRAEGGIAGDSVTNVTHKDSFLTDLVLSCSVSDFSGVESEKISKNDEKNDLRACFLGNFARYSHKVVVDSWNNIKKYVGVRGAFFIFDEQRVVGYGAWSRAFIKITRANKWILLSATPGDTWSDYISVFIANNFYHSKKEFLDEHAIWSRWAKYPKIENYRGVGRLLAQRNDILIKMPVKKDTTRDRIYLECGYDKVVYRRIFKDRWNPFDDIPIEQPSQMCYLLRRVVNSDQSRIDTVKELIRRHKKLIIFYNFDYELEILKRCCSSMGRQYWQWNGKVHERIVKDISESSGDDSRGSSEGWVYIVQYTAGCEGWNCIETNVIVFYSLSYSYRQTVQAEGRIDRRNTSFKQLFYYFLVSYSSIDISIKKALNQKKNFNENDFFGRW